MRIGSLNPGLCHLPCFEFFFKESIDIACALVVKTCACVLNKSKGIRIIEYTKGLMHGVMPFVHQNFDEICTEIFLQYGYLFWRESHILVSFDIAFALAK